MSGYKRVLLEMSVGISWDYMLNLQLKADLEGVTDLKFKDSISEPFRLTFKVKCISCRELHDKDVDFDQWDLQPLQNSRGEAHFQMKCKFCGKHGSVTAKILPTTYTLEESGKSKTMATFDCRGIDLEEFVPVGEFECVGSEKPTKFTLEFEDGEWYDYNDAASEEVSIQQTSWTLVKA